MRQRLLREQSFFIHVLKDYIAGQPSEINDPIDWDIIKTYADHHQVTAIFYQQTGQTLFQKAYASQIYRYINLRSVIQSLKSVLAKHQFVLVKGAVVAELYPVPELRSMGDVDVLIHPEDRKSIHKILLDNEFQFQKEAEGEWTYKKNGYLFEVHDSLVHRREELGNLVDYFSNVWKYVKNNELDWSFHLLYLIEHLRHHFVGRGVGFRQFIDLAVVCQKCEIDWNFVEEELKKIKLYDFASTVFSFNRRWFGIEVPLEAKVLPEEFYIDATLKILKDGVFGYDNENNRVADVAVRLHYQDGEPSKAKRKYLARKVFPTYESMCRLPYCPYVQRSKLLLPAAWVQRIVYRAFNKQSRKNMKAQLSQEKIEARMNMLKEWGL